MKPTRNTAGAHRPAPAFPPIDPQLCYPWRRLSDWGFGGRGVAGLQKAGLSVLRFHKQKFFLGSALISVLQAGGRGDGADAAGSDSQSRGKG